MAHHEDYQPREFVCIDCGTPVIVFMPISANEQDICSVCLWLRDVEDLGERAALRKFLKIGGEDGRAS